MRHASHVIDVVRLLKRIAFLLNKKVKYYNQISWVVEIVGIYEITSHHALRNSNVWH